MPKIGSINFPLSQDRVMLCTMKSERMTLVLVAVGLLAVVAAIANVRVAIDATTLVGFGAAAALVLLVGLDYRVSPKPLLK